MSNPNMTEYKTEQKSNHFIRYIWRHQQTVLYHYFRNDNSYDYTYNDNDDSNSDHNYSDNDNTSNDNNNHDNINNRKINMTEHMTINNNTIKPSENIYR